MSHVDPIRHRPVTLTVREDVLQAAKDLGLNTSQAAEAGIRDAVRQAQREGWLRDNKAAIEAYNQNIRDRGLPLPARWTGNGPV